MARYLSIDILSNLLERLSCIQCLYSHSKLIHILVYIASELTILEVVHSVYSFTVFRQYKVSGPALLAAQCSQLKDRMTMLQIIVLVSNTILRPVLLVFFYQLRFTVWKSDEGPLTFEIKTRVNRCLDLVLYCDLLTLNETEIINKLSLRAVSTDW